MIPFSDSDVRHRSLPIVNVVIIGINALVFLYELHLGGLGLLRGGGNPDITRFFFQWGFIPEELTNGQSFDQLRTTFGTVDIKSPVHTWGTIFSSMFIHGGFFHFAGNMMFLWVFGDNVEDWLGRYKYLVFYLLVGVVATLSQLAIAPHSQTPLVGASGAISGVMGAYMLLYPFNRINTLIIFYFLWDTNNHFLSVASTALILRLSLPLSSTLSNLTLINCPILKTSSTLFVL